MVTVVEKLGDSLVIKLPKSFLDENSLQEGSLVEVSVNENKIVFIPQGSIIKEGWEQAVKEANEKGDAKSTTDFENEDWTW